MTDRPEPSNRDHSEGRLILRFIRGKLRVYRIRDFRDALTRGERYE